MVSIVAVSALMLETRVLAKPMSAAISAVRSPMRRASTMAARSSESERRESPIAFATR